MLTAEPAGAEQLSSTPARPEQPFSAKKLETRLPSVATVPRVECSTPSPYPATALPDETMLAPIHAAPASYSMPPAIAP